MHMAGDVNRGGLVALLSYHLCLFSKQAGYQDFDSLLPLFRVFPNSAFPAYLLQLSSLIYFPDGLQNGLMVNFDLVHHE